MPVTKELRRDTVIESYRSRISQGSRIKLYKSEFQILISSFIEKLANAKTARAIEKLCHTEISLLEEGYKKLPLASNYIPRYRTAIKEAIADKRIKLTSKNSHTYEHIQRVTGIREQRQEHWAITYFKYSSEEYEEMDQRQAKVNRKRLLNLKTVELERYLHEIELLLHSEHKFAVRHQAIAIAAFTGRRIGEVMARGTFSLTEHPYLLHFTGQQKHERDGYEIITLIPAKELLERITQFRATPEIAALLKLDDEQLQEEIKKLGVQINRECNKRLNQTGIVPPISGKKTTTIHNLRSLWGAIAVYYFCPVQHHEYAFLQHYLGHVLESSATGHYFRYQLTGEDGILLNDKGIKLSAVPELPLLDEDVLETTESEQTMAQTPIEQSSDQLAHNIEQAITERFTAIQQDWVAYQSVIDTRLSSLETQFKEMNIQNSPSDVAVLSHENQKLKLENQHLTQQIQELQGKLDQFRQLLNGSSPVSNMQSESPQTVVPVEVSKPKIIRNYTVQSQPKGRPPGRAYRRAIRIFDEVKEWNRIHPDETFAINHGFLETNFKVNRKAVKQFCEDFQVELWEYHQELGIENPSSHNRGRDAQAIVEFVRQQIS